MASTSKLTLLIEAKNRGARAFRAAKRGLRGVADEAEQAAARAGRALEGIGTRLKGVGTRLSAFVTAPIIGAGAAAVKMASDAQESENLFRKSVAGMEEEAQAFVDRWTEATQLDPIATKERLGTFTQLLDNMGVASDRALEMGKNLTTLTVDFASFFNLPFDEAFRVLQSGLSGQMEALRRYGINVSQAEIKQVALREGLIDTGEELDQQTALQARYMALMEQTERVQGDFVDTSDDLANRLRQLTDRFKTAARDLGEELVPSAEDGLEVAKEMVAWFGDLDSETRQVIIRVSALTAAAGPASLVLGQLAQTLGVVLQNLGRIRALLGLLAGPAGIFAAVGIGVAVLTDKLGDLERKASDAATAMLDLRNASETQMEAQLSTIQAETTALEARRDRLEEELDFEMETVSGEEAGIPGAESVQVPARELTDAERRALEELREVRDQLGRLRQARERLSAQLARRAREESEPTEDTGTEGGGLEGIVSEGDVAMPQAVRGGEGLPAGQVRQRQASLAVDLSFWDRLLGNIQETETMLGRGGLSGTLTSALQPALREATDGLGVFASSIQMFLSNLVRGLGKTLGSGGGGPLGGLFSGGLGSLLGGPLVGLGGALLTQGVGSLLGGDEDRVSRSVKEGVQAGLAEQDRGELTLVIEGGFLDMTDPRQAQQFKQAMEDVTGRDVIVLGGT